MNLTIEKLKSSNAPYDLLEWLKTRVGEREFVLKDIAESLLKENPDGLCWICCNFWDKKKVLDWIAECLDMSIKDKSSVAKQAIQSARTWCRRSSKATEAVMDRLDDELYVEINKITNFIKDWEHSALMSMLAIPLEDSSGGIGYGAAVDALNHASNAAGVTPTRSTLNLEKSKKAYKMFALLAIKRIGTKEVQAYAPRIKASTKKVEIVGEAAVPLTIEDYAAYMKSLSGA